MIFALFTKTSILRMYNNFGNTSSLPMNYTTLISADELNKILDSDFLVLFDCRHDLFNPRFGREEYIKSHIAKSIFVNVSENLSGEQNGVNGRHPLPDFNHFADWLGQNGVDNSKQVVAYDSSGGIYGARLWWMLRWLGHSQVAVLNGGWQAWVANSGRTEISENKKNTTCFKPTQKNLQINEIQILGKLGTSDLYLLDARSRSRFNGKGETLDPVAGHIPGAINRFYENNLDDKGFFKPANILKKEFLEVLPTNAPEKVVHTCGSGISACHNLLAMEISDLPGSKLYPGSWSAWISDPKRPIA